MTTDPVVEFDQGRAVRKLWRHAALLLAFVLLGVAAAAAVVLLQGRTYTATSQVVVAQPATLQDLLTVTTSTRPTNSTLRDSQLRRIEDDRIADAVDAQLAGRPSYDVRFASATDSNLVGVVVTSPDRATARDAANAYGDLYVQGIVNDQNALITATETQIQATIDGLTAQITTLEQTLINASSTSLPQVQAIVGPARDQLLARRSVLERQQDQLRIAKNADLSGARVASPAEVVQSSMTAPLVLGGLLGLLLGVAAVALREKLSGRAYDERDVVSAGLAPRIVSEVGVAAPRRVVSAQDDRLPTAQQARLRALAAALWPPHAPAAGGRVCLVAPVDDQAGAVVVLVARLARQLEALGSRVAVVEGDAQGDGVARAFGVHSGPGVAQIVRGDVRLDSLLAAQDGRALIVLPAGDGAAPADVYGPGFAGLLQGLGDVVDVVLVVGTPLVGAAEALVVTPLVDRLVVVVGRGRSSRKALQSLQHSLAEQHVTVPALLHPDVLLHKVAGRRGRRRAAAPVPVGADAPTPAPVAYAGGSSRLQDPRIAEDARLRVSD